MKKIIIMIMFCGLATNTFSQTEQTYGFEKRNCISVGILQGGGSLVGADLEFLVSDQVGLQVGAGLVGFGGGLNYHFQPSIRSSFIFFAILESRCWRIFCTKCFGANVCL